MEEATAAARLAGDGAKQEVGEARRALALARANAQEAQQRLWVQEALLEDRNAVIEGGWCWDTIDGVERTPQAVALSYRVSLCCLLRL